jgi:hypothetical protein
MKQLIVAGLLALPLAALFQEDACAWCKFNATAGASLGFQSGGSKSILWGAYQSSDYPTQTSSNAYSGFPGGYGAGFAMPPAGDFGGGHADAGPTGFGDVGPEGYAGPAPMPSAPPEATPETAKPTQYRSAYPASTLPIGYYYPSAGYDYYQAPWYGN